MDENELAGLLVKLSKALMNLHAAEELYNEYKKEVDQIKDRIDKSHPMFMTLFQPGNNIRHIRHHKVNRGEWAPQIIEWAKKQQTPITTFQVSKHFNVPMSIAGSRLRALAHTGELKLIAMPRGGKAFSIIVRG